MEAYQSTATLPQVVDLLLKSQKPLLTTHAKPDGDAFGSATSLARAMQLVGSQPTVLLCPPVPSSFAKLKGADISRLYTAGQPLPEHDLVVVLDTGAWAQVVPMDKALRDVASRTVVIDHHLSGDIPAMARFVDHEAPACAQIVFQVIELMMQITGKDLLDATVCEQLFVGIASDTGWFRFSNTRPSTHELAAKLLRLGVDQSKIYEQLEQTASPQKLALIQKALASLTFLADGQVAIMALKSSDFQQTGAKTDETEGIIDLPRMVAGVEVAVLLYELTLHSGQRQVRISFRSRPGDKAINVAHLAAQFGGGGHARAAGAKSDDSMDQVAQQVGQAVMQAIVQAKQPKC